MAYEDLVCSMEAASEQKNHEILEKANREAADILRDSEERAASVIECCLQESRQAAEVERNRLSYLASEEIKTRIAEVKKEFYSRAFADAVEGIRDIREKELYPSLFKNLLLEAVRETGDEQVVIHIDPRDTELCRKILEEIPFEATVISDIITGGGLLISRANGNILTYNTAESRLEQAKEHLKLEVYTGLAGE
ncbi:MAG: hypothetical protein LUQ07_03495 [Methanospirillum sp.]|nr:hypothetical protein [Methanospirillum sp.]